jgi:hypothetical protein
MSLITLKTKTNIDFKTLKDLRFGVRCDNSTVGPYTVSPNFQQQTELPIQVSFIAD